MGESLLVFFQNSDLWAGALLAGAISGAALGFLGLYVLLHRMVFVSAAMSEVSSLGVMIAFWLAQVGAVHESAHTEDLLPLLLAALFTGVFSVLIAGGAEARLADRTRSAEAFIGGVYLLSAAGLLIVGDRVSQGAHDVSNILFGNAVIVDRPHLILLASVFVPIFILHLWLKKDVLLVSFDPATARTMGYPVRGLRLFLLISLGVLISIGTRTLGALPIFSFTVLPGMAALALVQDLRKSFVWAAVFGALSATLGYFFSYLFSLPTGACITATGGLLWLAARVGSRLFLAR